MPRPKVDKDDSDAEEIILGSQDSDDADEYISELDPDYDENGGSQQLEEGEITDFLEEEEPLRPYRKTVYEYNSPPSKKSRLELAAAKASLLPVKPKYNPPPAPVKQNLLKASVFSTKVSKDKR
jgi:hypothetical protein